MDKFKIELGEVVTIEISGETGKVVARAEYLHSEQQYLVHYKCADGRAIESWWGESAIFGGQS